MEVTYLSKNSDADVLTTGLVDQRVQLLRWKWAGERRHSAAAFKSLIHVVKLKCFSLTQ